MLHTTTPFSKCSDGLMLHVAVQHKKIRQVCVLNWNTLKFEVAAFEINFSNSLITHVSNSEQNC